MKDLPKGPADELLRRLRDDLVELLGRRAGGRLYDELDDVSGEVTAAARTHRAAVAQGGQRIAAGSRDMDRSPLPSPGESTSHSSPASHVPEDDTLSPVTESRDDNPPPGQPEHFVLRLTQEDRSAFASLAKKLSLQNMTGIVKPVATLWEMRGKEFSDSEKRIIALLDDMQAEQDGKLGELDLKFRWVSASRGQGVPQLVEGARVHGGAAPKDPWTHIGDSVVEDFMAQHQGPGVLFVYDGAKLTPPTREEIEADWADPDGKHMYMYAMKPKPGLEMKDALLGMIRFDAPGDENHDVV